MAQWSRDLENRESLSSPPSSLGLMKPSSKGLRSTVPSPLSLYPRVGWQGPVSRPECPWHGLPAAPSQLPLLHPSALHRLPANPL